RIGLLAPNDLAYIPAAFGLLASGACFVPLASNLTPAEIAEIVREVRLNGCLAWPKADALAGEVVKGGEGGGFPARWLQRVAAGPPPSCAPTRSHARWSMRPGGSGRACSTRRRSTSSAWPTSGPARRSRAFG